MSKDYIVEEVRCVREEQAAKHNFDVKAILASAKRRQRRSGRKVVSFAPKRIETPVKELPSYPGKVIGSLRRADIYEDR